MLSLILFQSYTAIETSAGSMFMARLDHRIGVARDDGSADFVDSASFRSLQGKRADLSEKPINTCACISKPSFLTRWSSICRPVSV